MFNPKGSNLLDEQLAVSGLEMQWIGAAIGAVTAIAGGIMGAQQTSKNNAANKKAAKEQKKLQEKIAKATNKYNAEAFEANVQNYYDNKEYNWDTTIKNWKYNQQVQDYQYLQEVKAYQGSVQNTKNQLAYNKSAEREAFRTEQETFAQILASDAFNREELMLQNLQREDDAAMIQAGRSNAKSIQSASALGGRDRNMLDINLQNQAKASVQSIRDIAVQRFQDDQRTRAAMMIKPDKSPNLPVPTLSPDQIFVPPQKSEPGYVPPAVSQNPWLPLVQGIGSAASSAANISSSDSF